MMALLYLIKTCIAESTDTIIPAKPSMKPRLNIELLILPDQFISTDLGKLVDGLYVVGDAIERIVI